MPNYEVPFEVVTLEELTELLDPSLPLGFDTETDGLYQSVEIAQFYQESWDRVRLVLKPNLVHLSSLLLKMHVLIYNASYDVSTIQRQLGFTVMPEKLDDLFYLSRLKFFNKMEFALDDSLTYLLGYNPYAALGISKAEMHKVSWKPPFTRQQLLYAAIDVYHMPQLFKACEEEAKEQSYHLDMLTLRYFIEELQPTGLKVNPNRVTEMENKLRAEVAELAMPINVNSYKQVRPYIGSDESDDLGLSKLAWFGNEKAAKVKKARKAIKLLSFLAKFNTDRIYGIFAPSARSGRATCKEQNLQQLPRATKSVFGYEPDEGRVLIYSDYAQLELRCAAAIVNDHRIVMLIKDGIDTHDYVAVRIFGEGFTKQQRQITKTCNFNLLYGGGAPMLQGIILKQSGIWIELEEIIGTREKWLSLFTGFAKWHQEGIRAWRGKRAWATPMGRKYLAKLMTDQLNLKIQGFGAEVAKLALHYMLRDGWFKANDVNLANFVHDSYIFDAPDDEVLYKEASQRIADAMALAWKEVSKLALVKDLPMPVTVRVGYNWGDIEDGEFTYELKL